jgi:hypothetical protein
MADAPFIITAPGTYSGAMLYIEQGTPAAYKAAIDQAGNVTAVGSLSVNGSIYGGVADHINLPGKPPF